MDRRHFLQLLAAAAALRPKAAAPTMSLRQALESYEDWPLTSTATYPILTPAECAAQEAMFSIIEGRGIVIQMPDGSYDLMPLLHRGSPESR